MRPLAGGGWRRKMGSSCGQMASIWAARLRTIDSSAISFACGELGFMQRSDYRGWAGIPTFALSTGLGRAGQGNQPSCRALAFPAKVAWDETFVVRQRHFSPVPGPWSMALDMKKK